MAKIESLVILVLSSCQLRAFVDESSTSNKEDYIGTDKKALGMIEHSVYPPSVKN
jgi:hypothetical protein